ncbi:hypothetical protein OFM52_30720, partial [Escherichia coli]|nr:hypothetical protein [Escherichia coli]
MILIDIFHPNAGLSQVYLMVVCASFQTMVIAPISGGYWNFELDLLARSPDHFILAVTRGGLLATYSLCFES